MGITETELLDAAEKYKNIGLAYENAVATCVNLLVEKKRYEAKPGFFAKLRFNRRVFDAQHFAGVLLATYSAVTDHVSDASDVENISTIITEKAERIVRRADQDARGRQVNRDLRKALGVPDDVDFG
jgi:hypothetical protein